MDDNDELIRIRHGATRINNINTDTGNQRYWVPSSSAHWSEERTEKFKELFASGLSHSDIAINLGGGITRNACIGKANRLGLHRYRPPPKPKRKRIRGPSKVELSAGAIRSNWANPKKSNRAIAREIGVAESTIRRARQVLPVTLLMLQPNHCRFPVGEAIGADQLFCSDARVKGCPYCETHACEAYDGRRPRLREAA